LKLATFANLKTKKPGDKDAGVFVFKGFDYEDRATQFSKYPVYVSVYDVGGLSRASEVEHWFKRHPRESLLMIIAKELPTWQARD